MPAELVIPILIAMWAVIIIGLLIWFFIARARRSRLDTPTFHLDPAPHDETRPVEPLPPVPAGTFGTPVAPGPQGVPADEPFGRTTLGEYERLAAESFQAPPAAALGQQHRAAPFSWEDAARAAEQAAAPAPQRTPDFETPIAPPAVAPASASVEHAPTPASAVLRPTGITAGHTPIPAAAAPASAMMDESTVVSQRGGFAWNLVLPDGQLLPLAPDVVVGRRPSPVSGAELLQIPDTTRTVSKSHARLRFDGERWLVTDLGSTNGLGLVTPEGQTVASPYVEVEATPQLRLGTLLVELRRA